jgi:hypothetical protein
LDFTNQPKIPNTQKIFQRLKRFGRRDLCFISASEAFQAFQIILVSFFRCDARVGEQGIVTFRNVLKTHRAAVLVLQVSY